ncbi:ATP-grasp peptide maturase system methyltransferase [Streptomyces sp. CA-278952]|uniref:ATP-grasp peptide maturase system methyltransferase n=1 Tax=Streptomyces sp. CA-278952 TaxID=2980556 RepID=UPI0023685379|nr:ATP-grasp peptide maturase system methyltransferase [Streptomyces sp. CA-278952]WDG31277.1 ATP-grasp peptide maturase system methyltransferase [Streptomyces sp. CA-278952]
MSSSARLRTVLADALTEDGALTDPAWHDAAQAVPRELFLSSYFVRVPDSAPTSYRPVHQGEDGWLEGIYTDRTLITQLDGRVRPGDVTDDSVTGDPTSSSTLPSLVLRMWQQLDVDAGQRVLEVGTGTGYSTALGAHRLGDDRLTSIEYDPVVGRAAASALASAGYAPRLVVGDGLRGDPYAGPSTYDRLIATCSVRYVPLAWLHQVKPGGKILVTLSGWGYASGLTLLTVTGPGSATGRLLPGFTSFMIARPHDRPPRPALPLLPGEERPSLIDPAMIGTWTGSWVAQLAAPAAERMGAGAEQILWDVSTGSQARTGLGPDGGWTVVQRGPVRLWDRVETAIRLWQAAGEPHQEGFGITVSAAGQRVWIGSEDGTGWDLPM